MKRLVFLSFLVLCGCQSTSTELPVVEKTPVAEAESGTPLKVAESHRENPILKADYVESVLGARRSSGWNRLRKSGCMRKTAVCCSCI